MEFVLFRISSLLVSFTTCIKILTFLVFTCILSSCGGGAATTGEPAVYIAHRNPVDPNSGILSQDYTNYKKLMDVKSFSETTGLAYETYPIKLSYSSLILGADTGKTANGSPVKILVSTADNVTSLPSGNFTFTGFAIRDSKIASFLGTNFRRLGTSILTINLTSQTGNLTANYNASGGSGPMLAVTISEITSSGKMTGTGTSTGINGNNGDATFIGYLAGPNATEFSGVADSQDSFVGVIGSR